MADTVTFQTDDDLDEQNLTNAAAKANQTDYKERGLGFTYNDQTDTLDIGNGHAVIESSNQAWDVYPDARSGLSLTASDVNHVYLWMDTDDDDTVGYHIDTADTAPTASDVSADGPLATLKVGTVDTNLSGSDATDDTINDAPPVTVRELFNATNDAAIQARWDGLVVPVAQGLGALDAIEPSNSSTPVDDAVQDIYNTSAGVGMVLLPPENVDNAGTVDLSTGRITLLGTGRKSSKITVTGGNDGINLDGPWVTMDRFALAGPGAGGSQADAVVVNEEAFQVRFGTLEVDGWHGRLLNVTDGANPTLYNSTIEDVRAINIDAGDVGTAADNENAMVVWYDGINNTIQNLILNADDSSSGADSRAVTAKGPTDISIQHLAAGGTVGASSRAPIMVEGGRFAADTIVWEPDGANGTPTSLIKGESDETLRVEDVKVVGSGAANNVYDCGSGRGYIGSITGKANLNDVVWRFRGTPSALYQFEFGRDEIFIQGSRPSSQLAYSLEDQEFVDPVVRETGATHTTGGATTISGVASEAEDVNWRRQRLQPSSTGQVSANYAAEAYMVWNDGNSNWDLRLEWVVDPGSDVNFDVEFVATPAV